MSIQNWVNILKFAYSQGRGNWTSRLRVSLAIKRLFFYLFPKFRWWGVQSCYRTPACKARTISKIFFICDPSSSMNRKTNQKFPKRKSSLTDSAFQRPSIIEIWMAPHNSCPKKPAKTTKWKTWWNNKFVKETKKKNICLPENNRKETSRLSLHLTQIISVIALWIKIVPFFGLISTIKMK